MLTAFKLVYILTSLVVFLANVIFASLASYEGKEGINRRDRRYCWNPFNLVYYHPEDLTEKGRRYRRLHFACLGVFLGMLAISGVFF
jgi:hypothetical protein